MAAKKKQSPVDTVRQKSPFIDHLMAMQAHFGKVQGSVLAGAVTFFAFISFFPIMAVAFVGVAQLAKLWPEADENLVTVIQQLLPGIIGNDAGQLSLETIQKSAGAIAGIGVVLALWSALGWISGMRGALIAAFEIPPAEKPNFVMGKAKDLLVFATIGIVMLLSVSVTSFMAGFTDTILSWIGMDGSAIGALMVQAVGILLGLTASTVLFFVIYKLLAKPDLPSTGIWQGALFGAIGFEILKYLVVKVMGGVGGSPVAQLAIALSLVVWINYFNKLLMYGCAWAMTSRHSQSTIERRTDRAQASVVAADSVQARPAVGAAPERPTFDAGSAIVGGLAGGIAALLFWRSQD